MRGLLGRIGKQIYVDAGDRPGLAARRALRGAVGWYEEVYREDRSEHYWHGINVVACLARAERDGVSVASKEPWRTTARAILDLIEGFDTSHRDNLWAWATAVEACVALGEGEDALNQWFELYLHPKYGADAFEFASTYRQLTQVWQLRERNAPAASLLPSLRGALLSKGGGYLDLQAAEVTESREDPVLQGRFGPETATQARWIDRLSSRCDRVARIEDERLNAVGTGFLVQGRDLYPAWGEAPVLLTNAHVVSDPRHPKGVLPEQARVSFTRHKRKGREGSFRVGQKWTAPDGGPDASVLELRADKAELEDLPTLELAKRREIDVSQEPPARLIVIGHPEGRDVEVSLHDNYFQGFEDIHVYYRSPTEAGSSGSPVLTEGLYVLAVHRAEVPAEKVNQGVLLDEIKASIEASPPG